MKIFELIKSIATKIVSSLLKKLFGYPKEYEITMVKYKVEKATGGGVLRECASIWSPTLPPPYNEENWHSKICALVIFGVKILHFTVIRKEKGNRSTGSIQHGRNL